MKKTDVVAFDYGASSGRAMLGSFDGKNVSIEELHRFTNDPVIMSGTLFWDTPRQLFELTQGLIKAKLRGNVISMAVDTWGVDFGLIGRDGYLLENGIHYRDGRTDDVLPELYSHIPRERLYDITGIQHMSINTVCQLYSLKRNRPELLSRASSLLFTPDLFNYLLTGEKRTEYTIASTSQLLDARKRDFSNEILGTLGISRELFPEIIQPGSFVGGITKKLRDVSGLPDIRVLTCASHDTASAVLAVPCTDKSFAFLSSGTWSLMGTELDAPVISPLSKKYNMTNEGGAYGTIRFLKNIAGLWLLQECRRALKRAGEDYSYAQLEALALEAEPFYTEIDPDYPEFSKSGDLPARIREYCRANGHPVPDTVGRLVRCIYEGLAAKYKATLAAMEECTGKRYPALYIVGGGVKDTLLNQMTADACGIPVITGPSEATVYGNVMSQLIASGELASLNEAREIIKGSVAPRVYYPK